jgi:alpha-beta hydrolase superfamily lysophospholipase
VFLLGPRVQVDESVVPVQVPADPEAFLATAEASVPGIRPGAEKGIVWADPRLRARTPVSLVYLHGFSADRHEIDPVPQRVAGALGANLFYARLTGHGRDGSAMAEASVGTWLQDVEEALAVGTTIGRRVVLMGTSTGGTLALWAAGQPRWRDVLEAVVLLSPNLGLRDPNARLLLLPWGKALARLVVGKERCFVPVSPDHARHWTTCYPTAALLPMMALVERVRTLDHAVTTTPLLVLYSPRDAVVNPAATRRMFEEYGASRKELRVVEGADDPQQHVLAGDVISPASTDAVIAEILDFLRGPRGASAGSG